MRIKPMRIKPMRIKPVFHVWIGSVFAPAFLIAATPVLVNANVFQQQELDSLRQRVEALEAARDTLRQGVDIIRKTMFEGVLPGFFHIPGTNSSMKFGGYIRMDAIRDFDQISSDLLGFYTPFILTSDTPGDRLNGNTFYRMSATRLNIDVRTPFPDNTTFDELRLLFETDFWPNGSFRIRHAYGQWGPLLVGQTWETWYDVEAAPIAFDYAGPPGGVPLRVPMIRWTQPLGSGFSLTAAAETPDPEVAIPTDVNGVPVAEIETRWPDLVVAFEKRQVQGKAWHLRLSGLLRDLRTQGTSPGANTGATGWGLYFTGRIPAFGSNTLGFGANIGEGVGHYLNALSGTSSDAFWSSTGLEALPTWSAFGTYQLHWSQEVQSNFTYGYLRADNLAVQTGDAIRESNYVVVNIMWNVTPLVEFGIEYLHLDRHDKDGAFGVGNRLDLVFIYSFTPGHPYPRHLFN